MIRTRALNYAYRLACLTAFIYALTVFVFNPGIDLYPAARLHEMVYGTADKPFVLRVLVPLAVRGLVALTPAETQAALNQAFGPAFARFHWKPEYVTEYLWVIVVLGVCLAGFWAALRDLLDQIYRPSPWAGRLIPLLGVALLPMFYKYASYIYDFSTLLLFTLGLALLARRQWGWFALLYPLACLNKETTILLTLVFGLYFYSRLERSRFVKLLAYQLIVFVIIKLGLTYMFRDNPGTSVEFHLINYNRFILLHPANPFYIVLGFALVVAIGYAWDHKPPFLKTALWVLVPLIGLCLLFGFLDEWRDYYEAYPPLLLLLCDTIARVWSSPLQVRGGGEMRLLVVRRGDLGLYQRFRAQVAADPTVKVITDRRWAERRRDSLGHEPDRRRGDRRRDERYVSLALRSAGWAEVGMRTPNAE